MATREAEVLRFDARTRQETDRERAEFNAQMAMVRHLVHYASTRETAEIFYRQLMKECVGLQRRYGFKG